MCYLTNFSKTTLIALLCLCNYAYAQANENVDWIVAVVNDEAISNSRLAEEIASAKVRFANLDRSIPQPEQMRKIILPALVDHVLQLQRARQLVGEIAPVTVESTLRDLFQKSGAATLEDFVASSGRSVESMRIRLGEEMAINEAFYRDNQVSQDVDELELDAALRVRLRGKDRREYLLEHVHLASADKELAREFQTLRDDFAERAEVVSISAESVRLGWRTASHLPDVFFEQVKQMKPDTTSAVLQLKNGLHVLHLVAIRPRVPGQMRKLVRVKVLTVSAAQGARLASAREQIVSGATNFEELATALGGEVTYLEETPSALPELLAGKQRLRVGQLAGPYQVGDKHQLALVVGEREELIGDENLRNEMRVLLTNDNFERLRLKWLKNLRSVATIKYLRESV